MKYNVIDSIWWNSPVAHNIGAVVIETNEGKYKCYIGNGDGYDIDADVQKIASQGAKILPNIASEMFPYLEKTLFIV